MTGLDNKGKEEGKSITYYPSQKNNRIPNTTSREKKENIQSVNPNIDYNKTFFPYKLAQKPLFLGLMLVFIGLCVQMKYTFAFGNELKEELLVNLTKSKDDISI